MVTVRLFDPGATPSKNCPWSVRRGVSLSLIDWQETLADNCYGSKHRCLHPEQCVWTKAILVKLSF